MLSTPSMVLMMEEAARLYVDPRLPEGYVTVGTKVCVSHLKAVPVGA